jgi:CxxC motif-containing protein (DUF1111 family)
MATRVGVVRGNPDYGYILNTAAIRGFQPEARVSIEYTVRPVTLTDGTIVELREPRYHVDTLNGPRLAPATVLMPRMPPPVQGAGLLELVPAVELERVARSERQGPDVVRGRIAWLGTGRAERATGEVDNGGRGAATGEVVSDAHGVGAGRVVGSAHDAGQAIGRFGWQASEPSVASQVAVAFAREMGLTNPLAPHDDCGAWNVACLTAPSGGSPEVEPELFEAVVNFQLWHAVPVIKDPDLSSTGAQLFESTGCAQCHRTTLRVDIGSKDDTVIHPFTDLLLHDMGRGLADRTLDDVVAPGLWRTAPLWGVHAASVSGQPQHLLHDGRARSIDEAILWHDGEARVARDRFSKLTAAQRRALTEWIQSL